MANFAILVAKITSTFRSLKGIMKKYVLNVEYRYDENSCFCCNLDMKHYSVNKNH